MPALPDSGFDRVAFFYDPLARLVYGNSLEQVQLALLPYLPPQGRVLVIGGGSGWILEQLLRTQKLLDILYLDAAPAMVRRAQQRYRQFRGSHQSQVSFRIGTEQALQPQEQFDAIITPFLLDLFPPRRLHRLMATLANALPPHGLWLFADFWPLKQPPPTWQQFLIWGMYTFFGALSNVKASELPDYSTHFKALGFQEKQSFAFFKGMIQAKVFSRELAA
ncbi:methyltransferase family protein [Pontibacter ummariensis]|uniref:Methyltransferase domain-containing protein n=1 Tax=Pontibacter ummariensis TaxID=1610492 RepID=A0A239BFH7_9BACT|nr:class I SAM-dependent methyltransferase [Pontibacter ummariensis]PRY16532.1 methyltransferase family protein [Pontibacter ummariensis]SNS06847.1 Methyltransferase domain-containing protein [Pontibacter ummariensis]